MSTPEAYTGMPSANSFSDAFQAILVRSGAEQDRTSREIYHPTPKEIVKTTVCM